MQRWRAGRVRRQPHDAALHHAAPWHSRWHAADDGRCVADGAPRVPAATRYLTRVVMAAPAEGPGGYPPQGMYPHAAAAADGHADAGPVRVRLLSESWKSKNKCTETKDSASVNVLSLECWQCRDVMAQTERPIASTKAALTEHNWLTAQPQRGFPAAGLKAARVSPCTGGAKWSTFAFFFDVASWRQVYLGSGAPPRCTGAACNATPPRPSEQHHCKSRFYSHGARGVSSRRAAREENLIRPDYSQKFLESSTRARARVRTGPATGGDTLEDSPST